MLNLVFICDQEKNYFSFFLPSGVPILFSPLIVLIEFVSYVSLVRMLGIGLFANISSKHVLLRMLIGFSLTMLSFLAASNFVYTLLLLSFVFTITFAPYSIRKNTNTTQTFLF